jgi:uncharacterized Zn finger protein
MSWYSRRSRYENDYGYGRFAPYVPVAKRQANAAKYAHKLAKKEGRELAPVKITGRLMATTYWGKAWCQNLEAYSDFSNRLPRGRTYARNGSVIDLQIKKGMIEAIVSGSDVYTISIAIETLPEATWGRLKAECSESITSLLDLLQGRFDEAVMQRLAHPTEGLFPRPKEIQMSCSCPDYSRLCKHLAAVLYAVGNRLDASPEMLFTLRNVDHLELVSQALGDGNLDRALASSSDSSLAESDLGAIFGIDIEESQVAPKKAQSTKKAAANKPRGPKTSEPKTSRKSVTSAKTSPAVAKVAKAGKRNKAALPATTRARKPQ